MNYDGVDSTVASLGCGKMEGTPLGVTIHYLAERNVANAIVGLRSNKLGYHLIIDRDGHVVQCGDFSERMNHAGRATWRGVSPNRRHLAVAVVSWGEVAKIQDAFGYKAWTGAKVNVFDVVTRRGNVDNVWRYWDAATAAQEDSLFHFLAWAVKSGGIDPRSVCGHDEAAIPFGRKNDPGGVLSLSMQQIRDILSEFHA